MEIKVNEEILSCPYCGKSGEGIVYVIASGCSYAVYCDNCSAQGISMLQTSDAVKYWNELAALKLRSGGERTTNNARAKSAPEIVESDSPCDYCDLINGCNGPGDHGSPDRFDCFKGRRLSPVAIPLAKINRALNLIVRRTGEK
jgi:transcription elongation factor Elf1